MTGITQDYYFSDGSGTSGGQVSFTFNVGSSTEPVKTGTSTPAGDFLVLSLTLKQVGSSTNAILHQPSISDSSNTWTLLYWDPANLGGIWICPNSHACSSVSFGSTSVKCVWVVSIAAWSGVAASSPVDKSIMGSGSGVSIASGIAGATTNPGDLLVGVISNGAWNTGPPSLTVPPSPWNALGGTAANSTQGSTYVRSWMGWQLPGAIGNPSVSGTTSSGIWAAYAFALKPLALAVTNVTVTGPAASSASAPLAGTVAYSWIVPGPAAPERSSSLEGDVVPGYGVSAAGARSDVPAEPLPGTIVTGTGTIIAGVVSHSASAAPLGSATASAGYVYGLVSRVTTQALPGSVVSQFMSQDVPGKEAGTGITGIPGVTHGSNAFTGAAAAARSSALDGSVIWGAGRTVHPTIVPGAVAAAPSGINAITPGAGTFVINLCPNPSFEVSLAGWSPLPGTTLSSTHLNSVYGTTSLQAVTDGRQGGEGVLGPQATITATGMANVSAYVSGTGTVQFAAVSNPGGVLLGSTIVTLTYPWQRVELDNLAVTSGEQVYLVIQTPFPQDIQFRVDGVQYEQVATASQYTDGDQPQCQWEGTPGLSSSFRLYQFMLSLRGGLYVGGSAACIIQGENFTIGMAGPVVVSGGTSTVPGLVATSGIPAAAFDDFALFELNDIDPAMSYVSWNNANTPSGQTSWVQNYAIFHPPLDYPTSDPDPIWPRAAYMAVGFEFLNVPTGQGQNITQVEVSKMPLVNNTDATPVPLAYDTPRAIHTIIHPTRLNFCPNPSIEAAITGWTGTGAAVSRDTSTGLDIVGLEARPPFLGNTGVNTVVDSPANTVVPGGVVTASLYVYAPVTLSQSLQLQISWRDALNNVIGTSAAPVTSAPSAATWVPVSITDTAPLNTAFFSVELTFASIPLATDLVYVDTMSITVVSGTAGNTLNDPSFENGSDNWSGWSNDSYSSGIGGSINSHSGSSVAYLTQTTSGTCVSPSHTAVPGSTWNGSAWVVQAHTTGSAGTAKIGLQWLTATNTVISTTFGTTNNITGSYQKLTISGTAPAGTAKVALVLVFAGLPTAVSYGVFADDVYLGSTGWVSSTSFDSGNISNWSVSAGGGTLALTTAQHQSGTQSMLVTPSGLNVVVWSSTPSSMKVTPASLGDTAQITVPDLIVGNDYIASCYVLNGPGIGGAELSITNGTVNDSGTTPDQYNAAGWMRYWVMFTAQQSSVTMAITHQEGDGISYGTARYWVDDILIEAGQVLGAYFDGGVEGDDYMWETGGTAQLTRSYYYQNLDIKKDTVADILGRHTPVGLTCADPVFGSPFTQ